MSGTGQGDGGAGTAGHSQVPSQAHERLGELCRRLATAPGLLDRDEQARLLVARISEDVRAGRRPEELDDAFDELEELLLTAGYSAGLGSYRSTPPVAYGPLPGAGHGHPALYVLTCPAGLCGRVEAPEPDSDEQPGCRVLGQPLRETGLRT